MHILFLTRKYPPQKGGMETFSYRLTTLYPGEKTIIHYGQKQRDIVWVVPLLCIRALFTLRKTSVVHLGDMVLAPIALVLKRFTKKPIVATAHALELTYKNPLLRSLINASLSSIDAFVAVSPYTADLLKQRGVPSEKISVITHGVDEVTPKQQTLARNILSKALNIDPATCQKATILLTVGRLVKRKGVAWFIESVLPRLQAPQDSRLLYLIVSDGPDRKHIEQLIQQHNLSNQAKLLGKVSDDMLAILYSAGDIFVMPNIRVEGDAEGFGFVAIEAAAYGLPVIASNMDGIPAAIHNQQNGILVEPGNADAYEQALRQWCAHPEERRAFGQQARTYTLQAFRWETKVQEYQQLFERLV